MLKQIIVIAQDAGEIILKHYVNPEELSKKEGGSSLTAADLAANEHIVSNLKKMDPQIPIISEESELPPYEKRKNWERFWLVDPLDGTAEYLEKNGEFTVNIALIEKGEPTLGVIYVPVHSLLYYAEKNKGSWKKEKDLEAKQIYSHDPDPKGEIVAVASRRHGSNEVDKFLKSYRVREMISAGSSLKFCMVAEGKADLYPRLGPTMEWDVAAGDCIYRNSAPQGHRTTSLKYNKPDLRNCHFVIGLTNDTIFG
jgi:3'(2'), 5'-bisphosphate nucleotidase